MQHGAFATPLTPFTEGGSSAFASREQIGENAEAKDEGVEDENLKEARRLRIARRPQMPTKAKYDAHMSQHADYRDWCPDCVAGRGICHPSKA